MILKGKTVLVTGASRGLGAAIASVLAREGAAVCVNYLKNERKAEEVVRSITDAGGKAMSHRADVTAASEVDAMVRSIVERYGAVSAVVNNALPSYSFDPSASYTRIETTEWPRFQEQFEGAVKGAYNTTRAALPYMREAGLGKIINIATNLIYNPVVTYYDYTTAKAALLGLTRNLAAELGPQGIRVNLLAGGLLRTTDASSVTTPEIFDLIASSSPLRKAVTPEEFAQAVIFFVSDWSNAITGQSISIDAGLTMP